MEKTAQKINPLVGLMRQPKIYVKLPSNGKYWKEGSLDVSVNNEYPVFSMTARDELVLKTPDALLNGQAVVDVIQSCVPNIKNAWEIPAIDLEVILIALRLATYGTDMDSTVIVKGIESTYSVNLQTILDQLYSSITWNETIEITPTLRIHVKPLSYRNQSLTAIETFETQRIINLVNNEEMDDDTKLTEFKKSFDKLTNLTIGVIIESVESVETVAGVTTEKEFIKEFLENCDKDIFNKIKDHLEDLRQKNSIKPMRVKATEEMIEAGSEEEIDIPIVFDPSTFFA